MTPQRRASTPSPRTARTPGTSGDSGTSGARVVAIDGPAGAGKSTLAAALAEHLGLERLDTGAMYRAVAWAALERHMDLADADALAEMARRTVIEVGQRVVVDGVDATEAIRSPAVDAAVSAVAANPGVRADLVARQRAWVAARRGGVVEGRDIGTVVLPDADLKVYLTAETAERAARRAAQRGENTDLDEVAAQLRRRDRLDSTRRDSPLVSAGDVAADAVVVDSTGRTLDDVVKEVLACL